MLADEGEDFAAERLGQRLGEDVVALERAEDRHARQARLQAEDHAGEQGVGEVDDFGADLVAEPAGDLVDLLALLARAALEHGDGQVAEVFGARADGEARHPAQHRGEVEEAIDEPGRVAEQGELLLEVDVDAAEEDALLADVLLVGADGGVGRHEQRLVAGPGEGGHERVVAHARAAEHAGGPGGDVDDPHSRFPE